MGKLLNLQVLPKFLKVVKMTASCPKVAEKLVDRARCSNHDLIIESWLHKKLSVKERVKGPVQDRAFAGVHAIKTNIGYSVR